jgi:hypothetical protein
MRRVAAILFAWSLLLTSCEKQETEDDIIETEASYFPNSLGSHWEYQRQNHLTNITDTFSVTITGDTTVSDELYMVWEYDFGERVDIQYVSQNDDSVKFYKSNFNWIDRLYIIPFELGLGWNTPPFSPDTSYVSAVGDILINGSDYENVARIERSTESFNYFLDESIWIKPGVGLVKFQFEAYNIGAESNETWELIEFQIQ